MAVRDGQSLAGQDPLSPPEGLLLGAAGISPLRQPLTLQGCQWGGCYPSDVASIFLFLLPLPSNFEITEGLLYSRLPDVFHIHRNLK